jgi:hypothetical protein
MRYCWQCLQASYQGSWMALAHDWILSSHGIWFPDNFERVGFLTEKINCVKQKQNVKRDHGSCKNHVKSSFVRRQDALLLAMLASLISGILDGFGPRLDLVKSWCHINARTAPCVHWKTLQSTRSILFMLVTYRRQVSWQCLQASYQGSWMALAHDWILSSHGIWRGCGIFVQLVRKCLSMCTSASQIISKGSAS